MFEKFLGKKGITALTMAVFMLFDCSTRVRWPPRVSIATPSNGATVSGMVTVTLSLGSGTAWANVYVDGFIRTRRRRMFSTGRRLECRMGLIPSQRPRLIQAAATSAPPARRLPSPTEARYRLPPPPTVPRFPEPLLLTSRRVLRPRGRMSISMARTRLRRRRTISTGTPQGYRTASTSCRLPLSIARAITWGHRNRRVTVANGGASTNSSSAVTLTSPANGSTVSGNVNIAAMTGSGVGWVNFYVDGSYLSSSPPLSVNWNSGTVGNGNHTISVQAFNSSSTSMGSASAVVNVSNSGVTPFKSLLHAASGIELADRLGMRVGCTHSSFEPRPPNYTANHTVPSSGNLTSDAREQHGRDGDLFQSGGWQLHRHHR